MARVAWLGLGIMGFPMAGHLAAAGHDVTVYNRTAGKAQNWCGQHEGRAAVTPAQAAEGAEFVFACVGNDDDLQSITTGSDGAFSAMTMGSVFVDCTTASANIARELARTSDAAGFSFLDAPVSGGQAGAEDGVLTVMIGGADAAFKKAEPVIRSFARKVSHIGPSGSGQTAKMVNQLCIAGIVQGLAEGLSLAQRAGLDIPCVMETLSEGAAGSWQMTNRWETMAEGKYEFGFAVDWMRKDLAIALAEVERLGGSAPMGVLVDQFYSDIQRKGGGRWDTSSLLTRLE